jgi:hypothetical protein
MSATIGRRRWLTFVAALALAAMTVVPAVAAKPATSAHVVQGNYIADLPDLGLRAVQRLEGTTDALGRVVFGYYEHTSITGSEDFDAANASKATVTSIRFFTSESGAPAAELFGQECWYAGDFVGTCSAYHVIVSDGGSVGQPDTFCGGPDLPDTDDDPCYSWDVTSGNIAIY